MNGFLNLIFLFSMTSVALNAEDFDLERDYKIYAVPCGLFAKFYIDEIPDQIKWHLKQGIYWESNIGRLIKENTKKGTIAIDVGAHIGIHSITMSRKVGPLGKVYSFEPQKKLFFELNSNLKLNKCENVITLRKALGENFGVVHKIPKFI